MYLLHFERPYTGRMQHYIGFTQNDLALGRIHTGQVVTDHVAAETATIDLGGLTLISLVRTRQSYLMR